MRSAGWVTLLVSRETGNSIVLLTQICGAHWIADQGQPGGSILGNTCRHPGLILSSVTSERPVEPQEFVAFVEAADTHGWQERFASTSVGLQPDAHQRRQECRYEGHQEYCPEPAYPTIRGSK